MVDGKRVAIEITRIVGEELANCNAELGKLPQISEMLKTREDKGNLTKYYVFSSQKCLLEKLKMEIDNLIKKESSATKPNDSL